MKTLVHTDFKESALWLTFPLPQKFLFQGIVSNIQISSGDVASFPLKIYCFSQGNIRYAFLSSILHIWKNLMSLKSCNWQVVWYMQEPCSCGICIYMWWLVLGDIDTALDYEEGNFLHIINWLEYLLFWLCCSCRYIIAAINSLYLQVA